MYSWPQVEQFVGRSKFLARLEDWWEDPTREPISVSGRRRVGKSWLLHRFAHGKPAVVLVASELALPTQLKRFAGLLTPHLGDVTPALESTADLYGGRGVNAGPTAQVTHPRFYRAKSPPAGGGQVTGWWEQALT